MLVNERRNERDAILKIVPRAPYRVEAVADEAAATASMQREPVEVIVLSTPSKGGAELVRRLRGFDASGQAYILAVVDSAPSQQELSGLFAAGINDFVRRPLHDAELVERLKAPTRLLCWARSVVKPKAFDFSVPPNVSRLRAWQGLGGAVAHDLSQIVGQALSVSPGFPSSFVGKLYAATIPMSLAEERVEVRVSVVVDEKSARWLKSIVLGDADASNEAGDDAMREFANLAGGALKRQALVENVTLTTGIPFVETLDRSPGQDAWSLSASDGSACIGVVGEIRAKENQRVAATDLCEGMVVVNEVRNNTGLLLVPAGARLTTTSAARLAKVLGSRFFLEVAPAA